LDSGDSAASSPAVDEEPLLCTDCDADQRAGSTVTVAL
jgi:hypothetical protein